jgi:hypothetical protein
MPEVDRTFHVISFRGRYELVYFSSGENSHPDFGRGCAFVCDGINEFSGPEDWYALWIRKGVVPPGAEIIAIPEPIIAALFELIPEDLSHVNGLGVEVNTRVDVISRFGNNFDDFVKAWVCGQGSLFQINPPNATDALSLKKRQFLTSIMRWAQVQNLDEYGDEAYLIEHLCSPPGQPTLRIAQFDEEGRPVSIDTDPYNIHIGISPTYPDKVSFTVPGYDYVYHVDIPAEPAGLLELLANPPEDGALLGSKASYAQIAWLEETISSTTPDISFWVTPGLPGPTTRAELREYACLGRPEKSPLSGYGLLKPSINVLERTPAYQNSPLAQTIIAEVERHLYDCTSMNPIEYNIDNILECLENLKHLVQSDDYQHDETNQTLTFFTHSCVINLQFLIKLYISAQQVHPEYLPALSEINNILESLKYLDSDIDSSYEIFLIQNIVIEKLNTLLGLSSTPKLSQSQVTLLVEELSRQKAVISLLHQDHESPSEIPDRATHLEHAHHAILIAAKKLRLPGAKLTLIQDAIINYLSLSETSADSMLLFKKKAELEKLTEDLSFNSLEIAIFLEQTVSAMQLHVASQAAPNADIQTITQTILDLKNCATTIALCTQKLAQEVQAGRITEALLDEYQALINFEIELRRLTNDISPVFTASGVTDIGAIRGRITELASAIAAQPTVAAATEELPQFRQKISVAAASRYGFQSTTPHPLQVTRKQQQARHNIVFDCEINIRFIINKAFKLKKFTEAATDLDTGTQRQLAATLAELDTLIKTELVPLKAQIATSTDYREVIELKRRYEQLILNANLILTRATDIHPGVAIALRGHIEAPGAPSPTASAAADGAAADGAAAGGGAGAGAREEVAASSRGGGGAGGGAAAGAGAHEEARAGMHSAYGSKQHLSELISYSTDLILQLPPAIVMRDIPQDSPRKEEFIGNRIFESFNSQAGILSRRTQMQVAEVRKLLFRSVEAKIAAIDLGDPDNLLLKKCWDMLKQNQLKDLVKPPPPSPGRRLDG